MTEPPPGEEPSLEHVAAWELLPWHVTGTLQPAEDQKVLRRVEGCARCRAELHLLRGVARVIRAEAVAASAARRHRRRGRHYPK